MKTYLYKDNDTNDIYTLEELKSLYMLEHNSDIDIPYKEFEHIIFTELVQNGGSISIVNDEFIELCNKIADNKEADRYLTQYERDFSALYNYRLLNELLEAYNDYCFKEFGHDDLKELPHILKLAYTTTENGHHEVQVNYNIVCERYEEYIDGELKEVNCINLQYFLNDLKIGSFDGFIFDILNKAEEIEGEREA